MEKLSCGHDDCGHTDEDHAAFDQGVAVGLSGASNDSNPYDVAKYPDWHEAWETGYSVHGTYGNDLINNPPFGCTPDGED